MDKIYKFLTEYYELIFGLIVLTLFIKLVFGV